eukprot:1108164-Prorocentrum_minimum.AAC.5
MNRFNVDDCALKRRGFSGHKKPAESGALRSCLSHDTLRRVADALGIQRSGTRKAIHARIAEHTGEPHEVYWSRLVPVPDVARLMHHDLAPLRAEPDTLKMPFRNNTIEAILSTKEFVSHLSTQTPKVRMFKASLSARLSELQTKQMATRWVQGEGENVGKITTVVWFYQQPVTTTVVLSRRPRSVRIIVDGASTLEDQETLRNHAIMVSQQLAETLGWWTVRTEKGRVRKVRTLAIGVNTEPPGTTVGHVVDTFVKHILETAKLFQRLDPRPQRFFGPELVSIEERRQFTRNRQRQRQRQERELNLTNMTECMKRTVKRLQEYLRTRGLSTKGRKRELCARLAASVAPSPSPTGVRTPGTFSVSSDKTAGTGTGSYVPESPSFSGGGVRTPGSSPRSAYSAGSPDHYLSTVDDAKDLLRQNQNGGLPLPLTIRPSCRSSLLHRLFQDGEKLASGKNGTVRKIVLSSLSEGDRVKLGKKKITLPLRAGGR